MTNKVIYRKWAPLGCRWIDWVRPCIFIGCNDIKHNPYVIYKIPQVKAKLHQDSAYFIDLPSYEGVLEGLGYANIGYRPIALYNGTTQQDSALSLCDNSDIQRALVWGTNHLPILPEDAPPVFLLDSNRMLRHKMNASVYDNSWDLYNQDIPSPEYFLKHHINKIIIHSPTVQRDLKKIFYKFQQKGITIYHTDGYQEPKAIKLKKPPKKDKFH